MPYPLTIVEKEIKTNKHQRSCGDCKACCVAFPMPFLQKKAWEPCRHLVHYGCGNYLGRPQPCRDFQCLFLSGHLEGDERRRPDNLGMLFYNTVSPLSEQIGPHVAAMEMEPGAYDRDNVKYLVNRLAQKLFIYVYRYRNAGHDMVGPRGMVLTAEAMLADLEFKKRFEKEATPEASILAGSSLIPE